jgi:hypothetical protein
MLLGRRFASASLRSGGLTMPRPFTPTQRRENEAFLAALHRTGNVRLSAREAGVAYGTIQNRRAGHPDFASRWDIALVDAHARFQGARPLDFASLGSARDARDERGARAGSALRTAGGEPLVVRTRSGRLQVRPAHRGKLTKACEQLFLQALSATCNVRLSAAAAGASPAAFYRRRKRSEAFDREFRLALEEGYDRLEWAAIAAAAPQSHGDDAWRENDPPAIPPMTASQALQLLYLHEKSVRQGWERPHRRRRRGESDPVYCARLGAMWQAEKAREAEREAVRAAIERDGSEPPPALPPLPDLAQVTGWSKASGKPPHDPGVALFGGWRMKDMERALRERGRDGERGGA